MGQPFDDILGGLGQRVSQQEFAQLIGVSEAKVSQMRTEGVLAADATAGEWLQQYLTRLREQAAGRMGADGSVDLAKERALLAREQRVGVVIRNQVAMRTYAPIESLTDVLASVCQAIVDRLDQVPSTLKRTAPDLPLPAREAIEREIVSARNEAVRRARQGLSDALAPEDMPAADEDDGGVLEVEEA